MDANRIFDAAKRNHFAEVKMLIENGGIPPTIVNPDDLNKETLAHIAARNDNLLMFKYLVEKDSSLLTMKYYASWIDGPCPLIDIAVEHGSLNVVRYMVENHNVNIYERFHYRDCAINWAILYGHLNIAKYFVEERRVDVNKPANTFRDEPLWFEAVSGKNKDYAIAKYFIEEGEANLSALDAENENILYKAVRKEDLEFMKYVLDEKEAQIDINWRNKQGETLVYVTVSAYIDSDENRIGILSYLINEKHADVNIPEKRKLWTPLHHLSSASGFSSKSMEYLLQHGASIEAKDINGLTPLYLAAAQTFNYQYERCKLLVEHGANVNQVNKKGESMLNVALLKADSKRNDVYEAFKYLIERGADISQKNDKGETLVHLAVLKNQYKLLDYLVRVQHVEVNTPRKDDNWTPLHCAAFWDLYEFCELLIEHGADPRAESKCGKTPAEVASDQRVISYIQNASIVKRTRRSVQGSHLSTVLQHPSIREQWHRPREIAGSECANVRFYNGPEFEFLNYLFMNLWLIQYLWRSGSEDSSRVSHRSHPFPSTNYENIDPLIEDAIVTLPDFKKLNINGY